MFRPSVTPSYALNQDLSLRVWGGGASPALAPSLDKSVAHYLVARPLAQLVAYANFTAPLYAPNAPVIGGGWAPIATLAYATAVQMSPAKAITPLNVMDL